MIAVLHYEPVIHQLYDDFRVSRPSSRDRRVLFWNRYCRLSAQQQASTRHESYLSMLVVLEA